MKWSFMIVAATLPILLAACAEPPLQKIVDEHKQQRIQDAYADKPIWYGSSDGVGMYTAEAPHAPVTVNAAGVGPR